MTRPTASEIRQQFIDYFVEKRGHTSVPSSPCVPHDDPTLLFANAGMNQFKDVFLATGTRPYNRAANTQKCIRAGGKHNDLDDVGRDTYHHTFFEMLGNWSFGDYFKKEAIAWAWELLTEVWGIDETRLHATYFEGNETEGLEPDTEARELWKAFLPEDRIHPGNKKDNFWEMGDVGPCGPCSEIHIDLTPDKNGAKLVNADDARVIEIWNLVFIQFNRGTDGKLTPLPAKHVDTGMGFERVCAVLQGKTSNYDTDVWTPLFEAIQKTTGVPAYSGKLEQPDHGGVDQSRAPDQSDADRSGAPDQSRARKEAVNADIMRDVAYRVVADHIRCLTFALTDGAIPSNEGRGYVLRRILRRGVRYGRQYFGMQEPFLHKLVPVIVESMGDAFPELRTGPDPRKPRDNAKYVADIILDEEASFGKTWNRGVALFESSIESSQCNIVLDYLEENYGQFEVSSADVTAQDDTIDFDFEYRDVEPNLPSSIRIRVNGADVWRVGHDGENIERIGTMKISGADAFKLHDTYGFPIDLTAIMAEEKGLRVDIVEYERLMEEARQRARQSQFAFRLKKQILVNRGFVGYANRETDTFEVETFIEATIKLSREEYELAELNSGDEGALALSSTPFYPEGGGQIGDRGTITSNTFDFQVDDTQKLGDSILHFGTCLKGTIKRRRFPIVAIGARPNSPPPRANPPSQPVHAKVDSSAREKTTKNHTATHLLNWALREVLGDSVEQKGSLVDTEKTRFDFSHNASLTENEAQRVEALVNEAVGVDHQVYTMVVDQDNARKINTLRAVFGEKYPDEVRVVSIGVPVKKLLDEPENPHWLTHAVEFCGGTHVQRSSEIGLFRLIEESAVAKGIRRVVGVTGERAEAVQQAATDLATEIDAAIQSEQQPSESGKSSKSSQPSIEKIVTALNARLSTTELPIVEKARLREKLAGLQEIAKKAKKEQSKAGTAGALDRATTLLENAETIGDITVITGDMGDATVDQLRAACDSIRSKAGSAAVFLATRQADKVMLLAAMTKDVVGKGVKAGDLIKAIAPVVGGKGGGRPDMAQGGGPEVDRLPDAVKEAAAWLKDKLTP